MDYLVIPVVFRSPRHHNVGGTFGIYLDLVRSKLYILTWFVIWRYGTHLAWGLCDLFTCGSNSVGFYFINIYSIEALFYKDQFYMDLFYKGFFYMGIIQKGMYSKGMYSRRIYSIRDLRCPFSIGIYPMGFFYRDLFFKRSHKPLF